nr:MAG TPA: hypothetical protein [Caudoviricetes sp.]
MHNIKPCCENGKTECKNKYKTITLNKYKKMS